MAFATAPDGARLHYRIDGPEGAPVVMLSNSLGTDLGLWERQLAALSGRRVLRWDARGHGRSDAPTGVYSMDLLGRDALAVLEAAGVERTGYCGISMGGAIGQWLALNAAERIEALVLANTAAAFGTPELWDQRIAAVLAGGMAAVTPTVLERWFTPEFRQSDPDEVERIRAMLLATPPQGYAGCSAAIRDTDFRADLDRIQARTLVIGGTRDPATPPENAQELASGIPGAKLVMIEAAHLSGNERPDAFNAALVGFLGAAAG